MLRKMVIKKLLKRYKKVPVWFYVLNIPSIKIKRKINIYLKSRLAQKS